MTRLTDQQIVLLLAAATGYDNRKAGQANLLAWGEASDRGHWTFEQALEAIHDHYARTDAFITPALISKYVRTMREHAEALADQEERRALEGAPVRDWRPIWQKELAEAKQRRENRRAAVLAHRDLRDALCQPPINFRDPQQWWGHLPQADTPRGKALHDIAAEAHYRQENP